jgi:bla regulator protein BlaR1
MSTHWLMEPGWGLSALEGLWRASWQGALWAALAWALTRAVPRMPSALRAGLWWLVSLKFVLSLGVLAPVPLRLLPAEAAVAEQPVTLVGAGPVKAGAVGTLSAVAPVESPVPWRQVGVTALLAAWGLGLAWQLRGHLVAWARVRRLRVRSVPLCEPELEHVIQELATEAGLGQVPQLRVSHEVKSPLATGLLSPVVVLPARALERLDAEALRMALAHELAHFQRRDLWLGWVPAAAETLLFFHPLVRKAVREYALAREEACDAEALRLTGAEPGDYGQLLLAFGVTRPHGSAAALGASSHLHALHRRLNMLEHVDVSTPRGRAPLRAALILVGLAVLVPFQVVAREPLPVAAPPAAPAAVVAPAIAAPAAPSIVAPRLAVAPVAPVPRVAPAPRVAPVPPVPPVPAVAPVPPVAPKVAMRDGDEDEDEDDGMEGFVLLSGDNATMGGSMADLHRAKALSTGGKDLLYVRRNGKSYVIRDPKMLEQARASFEPQTKLGSQQAELGKKQAELGMKQAELGKKQAELGMKQAEFGKKQAELSFQVARAAMQGNEAEQERLEKEQEKAQEALEKEQEALGAQQEKLGDEQEKLGDEQEKLGDEQEKLGDQMEKIAKEGTRKLKSLIDEAINKGLAVPADS